MPSSANEGAWPSPRIVYSSKYNIGFFGLEKAHPFDSRKYGRAWAVLRKRFGKQLDRFWVRPKRPANYAELMAVHSAEYLKRLREANYIADVLELPSLSHIPWWAIDMAVLKPMRWAARGSMLAAEAAMEHGIAINLSGGYHHASRDNGHGFSAYADVALAVAYLRALGKLGERDKVVYIDLDAHQGNGVCRSFFEDSRVFIYDQYNRHIFPRDAHAQHRIDCDAGVDSGCSEEQYLRTLRGMLPPFLDSVMRTGEVKLAIYNAGTDIYVDDQLGGMMVSAEGVLERDRFVLNQLVERGLPAFVVLSGGYSKESYRLVAKMAEYVLANWGSAGA